MQVDYRSPIVRVNHPDAWSKVVKSGRDWSRILTENPRSTDGSGSSTADTQAMDLERKLEPASKRDQARTLYLRDEYTDDAIAAAVGVSVKVLRSWAKDEDWDREIERIRQRALQRASKAELKRRVEEDVETDDKASRLIEGAIARFFRDSLSSNKKITATDLRSLVVAIDQMRVLGRKKRKG